MCVCVCVCECVCRVYSLFTRNHVKLIAAGLCKSCENLPRSLARALWFQMDCVPCFKLCVCVCVCVCVWERERERCEGEGGVRVWERGRGRAVRLRKGEGAMPRGETEEGGKRGSGVRVGNRGAGEACVCV